MLYLGRICRHPDLNFDKKDGVKMEKFWIRIVFVIAMALVIIPTIRRFPHYSGSEKWLDVCQSMIATGLATLVVHLLGLF